MARFYLLRHAQSEGNLRPEIVGGQSVHYNLSPLGREQARALGQRFATRLPQQYQIFASPAARTQQTAQIFCEAASIDPQIIQTEAALLELSQGDWTGLVRAEVYNATVLANLKADPWHFAAPNGESQADVGRRFFTWLDRQARQQPDMNFLVFTHGVAIKSLLRELFGFDAAHTYKIHIENASITRIDFDPVSLYSLHTVNDYAHIS